ncbi:MAG: histidine kinase [Candidatus Delongbacteria bacterium]|jgi:hypothetical protein|nr:histidine kinase [Candidatus Delongbacteria bacterium]
MSENEKYNKFQNLIFIIIWGFILTIPILLSLNDDETNHTRLFHEMVRIFPFFLLFLINHIFLYRILHKKKYLKYIILTSILIIGISVLSFYRNLIFDYFEIPRPPSSVTEVVSETPPEQFEDDHRPGPPPEQFEDDRRPGPPGTDFIPLGYPLVSRPFIGFILNILFSLLVIGINNSIMMAFAWMKASKDYEELEKENLKTQLAYLQHQINPHFFMNTLNNIHALIDFDSEAAKESIQKLAKLMRVLLYDAEKTDYTLQKEIDFLNDYIELMRIRLNEKTDIKFSYPDIIPYVKLKPLLFVSFIENAFKHGIRATGESFIHVAIKITDNHVYFEVSNSRTEKSKTESTGRIGLENSRKRLDLLYKDENVLEVVEEPDTFTVKIKLPGQV